MIVVVLFHVFDRFIPGYDRINPAFDRFISACIRVSGTFPNQHLQNIHQFSEDYTGNAIEFNLKARFVW